MLAEGFNSFLGNVLHKEGWPSEGRIAMLRFGQHVRINDVSITHLCLPLDLQWWWCGKQQLNAHYDLSLVPPRLLGYGAEQDDIVLILGQDRLEDFLVVILGKLDVLKAP